MGTTWLTNLFASAWLRHWGNVAWVKGERSHYKTTRRKRGPPGSAWHRAVETLAGGVASRLSIVKALSRALDRLPKVVSGGIDGCQTN